MEGHLLKVEERLAAVERDVAVMRSNYVTKADLQSLRTDLFKEFNAQTWRLMTFVCSFGTALVAATYFIAKHV